jgi:hypothetical protein
MKRNKLINFCLITVTIGLNSTLISYDIHIKNVVSTMNSIMTKIMSIKVFRKKKRN